jgi:hypothetical protein
VYRVLVGTPEGKRPLERPRRSLEVGELNGSYIDGLGWGGSVDPPCSGFGSMGDCGECGDEPLGSGATELVNSDSSPRWKQYGLLKRWQPYTILEQSTHL